MKRSDEHIALRDALASLNDNHLKLCTHLLLRVVAPSDGVVLAQWVRNSAEHLKAANELLSGLPRKSA
jgi:hypothetical protein